MEKEDIIKYIENPHELDEYSFSELRAVLKKYPYFQTAHQLLLLNLKIIDDPRFREFLKQSAVYIKNREKFYRLINDLLAREETSSDKEQISGEYYNKEQAGPDEEDDRETKDESGPVPDQKGLKEKTEKPKRDKDYSTAYLKQRISDTLSVQKEDSNNKKENLPDDSNDFFILDKASQVEEKMSRKFQEKFEKESREEKDAGSDVGSSGESDDFELDSSEKKETEEQKPQNKGKGKYSSGEYFTGEDYRGVIKKNEQNEDLIDKFIKETPEIKNVHPPENVNKEEDISLPSIKENEEMLSEKLANIYIKQGYYNKAISAYEKLSLKYPKKSDYFAEQIEKLRNIINEQQK
ncbi:MAG: hypothetical protein KGY69_02450 [Bacteroidales bacterium]|nr:hypothetical protein [Bacteroidales bacterium]